MNSAGQTGSLTGSSAAPGPSDGVAARLLRSCMIRVPTAAARTPISNTIVNADQGKVGALSSLRKLCADCTGLPVLASSSPTSSTARGMCELYVPTYDGLSTSTVESG